MVCIAVSRNGAHDISSVAGTTERPGRHVRAKSGLNASASPKRRQMINRSHWPTLSSAAARRTSKWTESPIVAILKQGWFALRRQREYQLAWPDGWLITVPPPKTSRTCPACGHVHADNWQRQGHSRGGECRVEKKANAVGAPQGTKAGTRPVRLWPSDAHRLPQLEPTEATQRQLNAAPERRGNL